MLAGFRLLQASKAFIRKSGVFRFINNPVKNYPKSGLAMGIALCPLYSGYRVASAKL
jgi:hypothetical protein|nr:MAG TPA: hypothetical protein [Inoviridae sp.]